MDDTAWERLGNPVMTGSQLADRGRRALRRLVECGIKVPDNNRLERAIEMVGWESGQAFPGLETIQEAARTVLDFYLITHAQEECLPATAASKLAYAITGGDGVLTKGERAVRDIQFELVVWGMLRIGGFPCWFEEPDLVVRLGDEEFGVAVKRVWSLKKAHQRLSDGAKQIADSGRRGIIATNVQEYLSVESVGSNQSDVTEKGRVFEVDVGRLLGQMPYLAGKPHVVGLLLSGAKFVGSDKPSLGPRPFDGSTFTHFCGLEGDGRPKGSLENLEALPIGLREWYKNRL